MDYADIALASEQVAATRSRKTKVAELAAVLRRAGVADVGVVVAHLSGRLPQGRIGLGYAALSAIDPPSAATSTLTVSEVDRTLGEIAEASGPGSTSRKTNLLEKLLSRATAAERRLIRGLVAGEIRQGALEGLMIDAVAEAMGVQVHLVRRAAMLSGDLAVVASALAGEGPDGLRRFALTLFTPVQPMLASTAENVGDALSALGTAAVEAKLDGARLQLHRAGDVVRAYTRNLRDVTESVPEIVESLLTTDVTSFIADGEVIALHHDGRPERFQDTMSRFGRSSRSAEERAAGLSLFLFDVLHVNGVDLIDAPAAERYAAMAGVFPEDLLIDRIVTDDAAEAEAFMQRVLEAGHEGVMVKALDAAYEAGRRGATWLKVKPVLTLDLVVLAVEWGSGRRRGLLSNIHLGALDPAGNGFVMLGKTFKGMTDEMLEWQTERFLHLETHRDGHVVYVRPEQVVEVAFDGLQHSSRYPGGLALRFARVKRYRHDKTAAEADTIDTVEAMFDRGH